MEENDGNYIAIIIIVSILIIWCGARDSSQRLEKKYGEIYRITQELKKEIIGLAEENDNFIRDYKEVIELAGGEDILDDYFHNSTAFEEVLSEFENDIEDIGW